MERRGVAYALRESSSDCPRPRMVGRSTMLDSVQGACQRTIGASTAGGDWEAALEDSTMDRLSRLDWSSGRDGSYEQ